MSKPPHARHLVLSISFPTSGKRKNTIIVVVVQIVRDLYFKVTTSYLIFWWDIVKSPFVGCNSSLKITIGGEYPICRSSRPLWFLQVEIASCKNTRAPNKRVLVRSCKQTAFPMTVTDFQADLVIRVWDSLETFGDWPGTSPEKCFTGKLMLGPTV